MKIVTFCWYSTLLCTVLAQHLIAQPCNPGEYFDGTSCVPCPQGQYQATDPFPAPGHNYYRLKEMAFDGKETYFNIVQVLFRSETAALKVYPNPVEAGRLHVAIEAETIQEIAVYDQQGRLWQRITYSDAHVAVVAMEMLPSGIYSLIVSTDQQTLFRKVVKR